ncbi:hypothetical protein OROGR_027685 [Orobanche gracilis]
MVGSLENLYESIENLDDFETLPKHAAANGSCIPLLGIEPGAPTLNNFYKCICNSRYCSHVSDGKLVVCPYCGKHLDNNSSCPTRKKREKFRKKKSNRKTIVASDNEGGQAEGLVTYMVTDDLAVTSMSANSSITLLLDKFNVKDVGILEEKVVSMGMADARKLLKASMEVRSVLTHVFLDSEE